MKVITVKDAMEKEPRLYSRFVESEEPVYCVHSRNNKKKKISFRALTDNNSRFWTLTGEWKFYFDELSVHEELEALQKEDEEKNAEAARRKALENAQEDTSYGESDITNKGAVPENFDSNYEEIKALSKEKKDERLAKGAEKLNKILSDPDRTEEEVHETLTETTIDSSLINKTVLEETLRMSDEEAKKFTRDMVEQTRDLVKNSTFLIDETVLKDELFDSIVKKSNGTVVQHMTRTYLRSVSFLLYYNNKLLKTSFANKIRATFPTRFRDYYHRILPHFHKEDIVLERVFKSGLQAVSNDMIHNFATGFLVHDIGKAKDIEYHEGEAAYDREKVVDHVRHGYTALMHKTDYPPHVGLIAGYHHEYYGDSSGYGYYRAFLQKHRKKNPKALPGYCISYSVKEILTFQALAYFPAKILEIIDIFDALTDPHRVYRSPLSEDEAISLMQEQFIDEHLKIDPILFHIFQEHLEQEHA